MAPDKLTSRQAAEYIGVTPGTLEVWRCNRVRHQPAFHKRGRKVVYLKHELDEYIAANRHSQT
jgi:hypothetical protein